MPEVGDLDLVTDGSGCAVCVLRTTAVSIVPLDQITAWHAQLEGEGDGSLAWWRAAHWPYYQRELAGTGYVPRHDMPIVFQQFERVFPALELTDHAPG